MKKQYLHDAIRGTSIELRQFYSTEEVALLLEGSGLLPAGLDKSRLLANLRSFAGRNIAETFRRKEEGMYRYLGAAWRYPVMKCYPDTLGDLRKEAEEASRYPSLEEPATARFQSTTKKRTGIQWSLGFVAMFLGIAMTLTAFGTHEVIKYLRSGPGHTLANGPELANATHRDLHLLAIAHYDAGHFDEAEASIKHLLTWRNLSPQVEADAFLLWARIKRRLGQETEATKTAQIARHILSNSPEEYAPRLREIDSFTAFSMLLENDYMGAIQILEHLLDSEPVDSFRGYFALLLADAHFWSEQMDLSLFWNQQAEDAYRRGGDHNGLANAALNRAWLLACNQETTAALKALQRSERLAQELGDDDQARYTALIHALIDKCHSGHVIEPSAWLHAQDQQFHRYVRFAASYQCGSRTPMVEDEAPPPRPPSAVLVQQQPIAPLPHDGGEPKVVITHPSGSQ